MHKLVIRIQRKACMLLAALLFAGGTLGSLGAPVQASPAGDNIVISQVYGGGGNSGATLKNDFIELYNPTDEDVSLSGWKVRYTSSKGTFEDKISTVLSGTIKSKGYFLIQQVSNADVGASLPLPDAVGTLAMGGSEGKVELLKGSVRIDLVGYGPGANESEAQMPTASLSSSKAAIRKAAEGAPSDSRGKDIDNNFEDFVVVTPDPRNSSYVVVADGVEAVSADLNEGSVLPGTIIKLSTPTVGASVYYSVYGAEEPQVAPEDFTWYQPNVTEIKINAPTTVHAYAKKEGFPNSALREYSYTISSLVTIAQARTAALGTSVTLSGVVTHRADSGAFVNLFVQDQNSGIIVRVPNSVSAQPGDMIEAYGKLTEFSGLLQLEATVENTKVTGSVPVPEPIIVDSTSFGKTTENRNKSEGRLVQVNNITIESVASGVVTAEDAVNGGKVIIYSSDASFVAGKTFELVTGVMTFHSSVGLELLPRNTLDIVEKRLAVQASIPSGGINAGGSVSLSTLAAGGVIHYTTDGSIPTASAGTQYTKAIVVNADMVIKAVVTAGGVTSDVSTFTYKVLENTDGIAIHTIQGETHKSLYNNVQVSNVKGIITSVSTDSFFMQATDDQQDNNPNTSEAIQVYKKAHGSAVKDEVTVSGTVQEFGNSPSLTVTQINATTINKVSSNNQLPKATLLGTGGRIIPNLIDSDSFSKFNPEIDAIDFFESLESMLVEVKNPTITGPYANTVTPITFDNGANNPVKTAVGGIVLQGNGLSAIDSSLNPQKLYVGGSKPTSEEIKTGDAFNGNIIGVIQYAGDLFKLMPTEALPAIVRSANVQKVTTIEPKADKLTIATFNVENFSAAQTAKAAKIASIIVTNMKQPDIIGLMEVQDNDGEKDTDNTDASQSFQTLIDAIKAKGGPTYAYADIAPEKNKDGGAPGGNIRVGFLYNPDRVTLAEGTKGDFNTSIKVDEMGGLTQNPGRIGSDDASTFASSRKPLVAEFMFQGKRVVAIANHLNSKGGDGKPWGEVQPVVRSSEVQRAKQAEAVNSFVKELTTKDTEASVVVLGDFNDFQFSGTLNKIKGNELTNLVDTLPVSERYSYIYDGNSQTLDHILVDKANGTNAQIDVVHVNADFSTEQGRVSDHDPLLAQLDLSVNDKELDMTILHTNDTHANLDTTNAPNNVLRRVTAIKETKKSSKNPILVDAGDVFSGTLYFNKYLGQADLEFMNLVIYDAMTFGNHEFDKNSNVLADFINKAEFPFVSSNVNFSKDDVLNKLFNNEIGYGGNSASIYPALVKVIDGTRVGLIGLTTEDTANIASPGDVTFDNAVVKAKETVATLQAKGINKIIVLSHIGYEADLELAKAVQGIDIIVGGHSHTQLDTAVVDNTDANAPKLIVQTGEKGQFLGKLEVSFNKAGVLTNWNGKLISIDGKTGTAFNFAEDAEAKIIFETKYKPGVLEMSQTVVGNTNVELNGLRADVRSKETNLGNLIADGMLAAAKAAGTNAVIALQNGGGIRASISAGAINQGGVLGVLPFNNDLVTITLTGQEIKDAMENGVSTITTTKDGRFPHIAGMRFDYDSTKPVNERVVRIQVKDGNSYVPIDLKAKYEVATNAFTAKGGDFYTSLEKAYKEGRVNLLYLPDYEVFTNYIQQIGTITAATSAVEGRIVDVSVVTPTPTPTTPPVTTPTPTPTPTTPPVTPTPTPEGPAIKFSDVGSHWAAEAIAEAVEIGFVNGYGDGTFRPGNTATRAQFVTMVGRALKLESSTSNLDFADAGQVPAWARSFFAQLIEDKIIAGYEDNTLRPSSELTRTEMTVILVRALGIKIDPNAKPTFADVSDIPVWARPYIAAAQTEGLVEGMGGNRFAPKKNATRADVVTLILAALEYEGKQGI
ncbi:5'-nucleotidase C-terminal domain-containing protein [Bacillus sp. FJAT-28004]|uniref:5'-nucleotidase C-terminal domain-containing protein n=1 Tax=Bacillus sp. FJAT-28004 TaxID=1679165 RepID=UPI0006B45394|nr:5'-nucleotidase C-terminal domain-containing protein [Bacillus sp. FJAT-28004]